MSYLTEKIDARPAPGHIWLVGAGPGAPDLITVRGLNALKAADVVVYDRLVDPTLLDHCRPVTERIYVGKQRNRHSMPQDAINALLVTQARMGRTVVRLKGGDPFIFGRGGEEMLVAREHGIGVSIVPGITAAAGCAAATGMPLTHRHVAGSVTLLTAHRCENGPEHDWAALTSDRRQTLVFYMGLSQALDVQTELLLHGLPATTPVALISNGTSGRQRASRCLLDALAHTAAAGEHASPCLIVVGEVVTLADPVLAPWASLAQSQPDSSLCTA